MREAEAQGARRAPRTLHEPKEEDVDGHRWKRRPVALALAVAAVAAVAAVMAATVEASSARAGAQAAEITDYVKYVSGKAGAADKSLAPVKIGWVNNQGGSLVIAGNTPTLGAETAVKWINKHGGGIGGHPVELVKCFVKNSEAEGLNCAQQFLNDKQIHAIAYGGLAVGANTIDKTVNGKKPIFATVSINASDATTKNMFILYTALPYIVYPWGSFAKKVVKAKTAAVVYPNQPGQLPVAQAVQKGLEAEGIKAKLVGFDPQASDLVGPLTAAGAQSADFIMPALGVPDQCLAFEKAITQLGIPDKKVAGFFQCAVPQVKAQYPGGDYPKWYYGVAAAGDQFTNNASAAAFKKVLAEFGQSKLVNDPWAPTEFSSILTIAKFMNQIGYNKLSPSTIAAKARVFKGPIVLGPPILNCGKYPDAPGVCADGASFFTYKGDGVFARVPPGWFETPVAIQKELKAKKVTP
jgi:branched-chain amino acid transport system substrate-binding protein